MTTEIAVTFIAKATVWIRCWIYNDSDVLVDPDTSLDITIVDHNNAVKVNAQDILTGKSSTGIYDYYYTLPFDAVKGWWDGEIHSVDSAKVSIGEFGFKVRTGITS